MTINLADNTPRVSYAVAEGVTQTSFTVSFEFFDDSDLNVYVDGTLKTLTTDYTVSGGDGSTGTVSISVTGASGGSTVVITRDIALERTTDFPASGAFQIGSLNTELDRLTAIASDLDDKASRSLQLTDYDTAVSLVLPDVDTRKGKTLAFNATTGAVESGPSISDVQTVSAAAADIATLADIEDGTEATDTIQTVAGISSNVTTVAGISANVTTVAGISADVTSVAADATDIGTVATNISSVNTVATNIADVITVANDLNEAISEVETVANDLNEAVSEIDTVAGSISNVDTVGTNIADVSTVAGISANVTTVAGISANVTTVAGISGNVTTVAGISADVSTVAADGTDIGTVATNISNVNTVAGISSNVTTVAGNSANVTTVATDITNVNTVASNIADVNNFALTYRIAASAPTTSLDEGDLYFDTTQNQMFVYDGSAWAAVAPDLVGDTSPQLGGNLDTNGNDITFGDNDKAIFGAGSDLQIYHDGSNSYIHDTGTGDLFIRGSSNVYIQNSGGGSSGAQFVAGGAANINYSGATKLSTTATGVDVTGTVTADGLTVDTNTLHVDSTNNRVGIGTTGPAQALDIETGAVGSLIRISGSTSPSANNTIYGDKDGVMIFHADAGNAASGSNMRFAVDGSEAMRISGGNLLVGATSGRGGNGTGHLFKMPSGDIYFEIMGNAAGSNTDILFSDGTGGSYGIVGYDHTNDALRFFANSGEKMRIDSSGNVGIGTSSPSQTVEIAKDAGQGTTPPTLRITNTKADYGSSATTNVPHGAIEFYMSEGSGNYPAVGAAIKAINESIYAENHGLAFFTNSDTSTPTERLRINSSGFVGISTDDPQNELDVRGTVEIGNGSTQRMYLQGTGTDFRFYDRANLAERLRIDSSGSLLVGTTASGFDTGADNFVVGSGAENAGMTIYSGTTNTGTINFADGTSGSAIYAGGINYNHSTNLMSFYTTDGSGRMYIDSSGNLLVDCTALPSGGAGGAAFEAGASNGRTILQLGTTSTVAGMTVARFYNPNGAVGSITMSGSSTAFNTSSDYRLKENVTADWDATTRLKQLNPVRFNFIADADTTVDGFLAHEVQSVVPEAITGTHNEVDADGNPVYQGIDQSKLVPLLVKTIQELEARIAALEAN